MTEPVPSTTTEAEWNADGSVARQVMRSGVWYRSVDRPIDPDDDGRFVVGETSSEWIAGWVHRGDRYGPYVETGVFGSSHKAWVASGALRYYTFLDFPPAQPVTWLRPP
jgi:hypothetical protein